jgi:arylsulfatase A-like enzyme
LEKVKQREPGLSDRRAKLVALIEHMDDGIGRVIDCLDAQNLTENTLVIFSSDNGGQIDAGANNGPLRDGKQSVYEGGLKVPMIAVWPGRIAPGTETDFQAMTMDLFPTMQAAAGLSPAQGIDGVNMLPTFLGETQPPLRKFWFFRRREGGTAYGGKTIEAVIQGDWKLLQNSPFAPQELYNLKDDPREQQNLIDKNRKVFQQLAAELRKEIQRYGRVPWQRPMER